MKKTSEAHNVRKKTLLSMPKVNSFYGFPVVHIIKILHEGQVWIDKSVPRVTFWHHEARRVMPNCDPRDRFVYPYLTRMIDSFSCTP